MAADKTFAMSVLAVVVLLVAVYSSPAAAVSDENKGGIELHECLTGVNRDCMVIVEAWMMFGDMVPPSVECCNRLIDMGRECHNLVVGRILERKRYEGTQDDVIRRSDRLREFCAFEERAFGSGLEAPAPAPDSQ